MLYKRRLFLANVLVPEFGLACNETAHQFHASREPGVLRAKCENATMISFGPDIRDPHSLRERADIPSVERFRRLLVEALRQLRRHEG